MSARRRVPLWFLHIVPDRPGAGWWVGGGIALALVFGNLIVEAIAGPVVGPRSALERRVPYAVALQIGALVALLAHHLRRTRADLEAWRSALRCADAEFAGLIDDVSRFDVRALRTASVAGISFALFLAWAVIPRLERFFVTGDWNAIDVWFTAISLVSWPALFCGLHAGLSTSRTMARVGGSLVEIDLFDRNRGQPIARFVLRVVGIFLAVPLLSSVFSSIFGMAHPGVTAGFFALYLVAGPLLALLPVAGLRRRVADTKRAELERLDRAIAGDRSSLAGSPHAAQIANLSLVELLAYRREVGAVREWPFDAPALARFAFYLFLPLASWIAAALVERGLDSVLG